MISRANVTLTEWLWVKEASISGLIILIFSCPVQLNRCPCHSLTESLSQSDIGSWYHETHFYLYVFFFILQSLYFDCDLFLLLLLRKPSYICTGSQHSVVLIPWANIPTLVFWMEGTSVAYVETFYGRSWSCWESLGGGLSWCFDNYRMLLSSMSIRKEWLQKWALTELWG